MEIYIDPARRGGPRVWVLDGRKDWYERCDPKELRGHELHFLPESPPRANPDHSDKYALDKPQTERFRREWAGEAAAARTPAGYILEVAFRRPGFRPGAGEAIGIEAGVCDDDGRGRESILIWTGTRGDFLLTMDGYGIASRAPRAYS